jgi:hypothetical protein
MTKVLDKISAFLLNWRISKKALAVVFAVLFIISLIPIVITAFYSVPVLDDYTFGLKSHLAYINGESFFGGVIESCDYFYHNWQGFFTANFLASIQPFNIDVHLYWISNIIVLVAICFSMFFFARTILVDVLHSDKWSYLLISIPIVTLFLQFMPGIQEGVYWMDGSLSLVVESVFLIVFSLVIKIHLCKRKNKKIIFGLFAILLSALFSGVGPITLVTVFMAFIPSLIYCIHRKYSVYKLMIVIMAIVIVGFLISAFAPGNAVRQASVSGLSLPSAIIKAVVMSVYYFGEWSTLFYLLALCFTAVVFYGVAQRTSYQFKYPLLVFVICYIIYAGRMSVQYYATGSIGAWRQLNQYYLFFLICMTISVLYFVGWLSKKKNTEKIVSKNLISASISVVFVIIIGFSFLAGSVNYCYDHTVSSVSTTLSLVKGNTQKYNKEMMERISIYEDESIKDVVVSPLTSRPKFFSDDLISDEETDWTNQSIADYYKKDSVVLSNE